MSQVVLGELDKCLGKRTLLQLHLGPRSPPSLSPPTSSCPKRLCTMAARAGAALLPGPTPTATTTTTTATTMMTPTTTTLASSASPAAVAHTEPSSVDPFSAAAAAAVREHREARDAEASVPSRHVNHDHSDWDATSWDATLPPAPFLPPRLGHDSDDQGIGKSVDETCKRTLDHFPNPTVAFPTPTLEFDFRVAVALKPEPSQVQGRAHKEIIAVSSGSWSGSFGHGKVMAGGYDLGQARGFRPIRIVEGAFIMQTTDEPPARLEMRTRGSLSGPCDILDALLSPRNPKQIDPRKYGFRMFLTIKTADKRYAEIVNCGLWVASGVWRDEELIIDAYRVT